MSEVGVVEPEVATTRERFFEHVANLIGGEVTASRVRWVVEEWNRGHHIVRGLRRGSEISRIQREGIRSMTPEGGYVSFWSMGTRVFGYPGKEHTDLAGMGIDTPFFEYAHTVSPEEERILMNMALTRRDLLATYLHGRRDPVPFPRDSTIKIPFPVPREKMALLQVEVTGRGSARDQVQVAGQEMFKLLERALRNGYQGGETFRVSV